MGASRWNWLYDPLAASLMPERRMRLALLEAAALAAGQRVLDVGCGTGTLLRLLGELQPEVVAVGIDMDQDMLRRARAKTERGPAIVAFARADAAALPFAAGVFDRVLSTLVFHHLPPGAKRAALREIRRVLRRGGELHLADWTRPDGTLARAGAAVVRRVDGDETTRESLEGVVPRLAEEAGFSEVREHQRVNTLFGTLALVRAIAE